MTHPATRSGFTPPPSPAAAALDRALDAWVRGDTEALDALDPGMEETVAQLYAWADVAGLPEDVVAVGGDASLAPFRSRSGQAAPRATQTLPPSSPVALDPFDRRSHRPLSRRIRIMTAFSGLAAALVLGLSIYGAVPLITDRHSEPTVDAPILLAASGDSSPTAVPANTPPGGYALTPIAASDCSAQARTRAEMLSILAVPPKPGSDLHVGNTLIDEPTLDSLNVVLRGWQACMLFGKPWQAMAYESDQYLRNLFYGDPAVDTAFSTATLNELLDAREQVSAARLEFGPVEGADMLMILDVSGAVITPDEAPVRSIQADVFWVSPYTGMTSNDEPLTVDFVWEDGAWKIRAITNFSGPPVPSTR